MHTTPVTGSSTVLLVLSIAGTFCLYLAAAWRVRHTGGRWSGWRTASMAVGLAVIGLAMSPPIAAQTHHDFSGHMVQHLLLAMVAPIPIVLSAPVTLVLRTLPRRVARKVSSLLRRQPLHALGHPAVALLLDTGALWLVYMTPLYAMTLDNTAAQAALHVHFVAAGCLFAWSLIGIDPAPGRRRFAVRLGVLAVAIAAHSTLAKVMYAHGWPRGTPYAADDIRDAAQIMYYGGDGVELILLVILFSQWYRQQHRATALASRAARPC